MTRPSTGTTRRLWWTMAVLGLCAAALSAATQAPPASVTIAGITAETVLTGPTRLAVDVAPAGAAIRSVSFFVDGAQVCHLTKTPFECSWDAGRAPASRTVRAVVVLGSGERLAVAVRTRGLPFFKASTDAILVPVHVADGHGRFVSDLTQGDFSILEDGVPQDVSLFSTEDAAVQAVLALDVSASMTPKFGDLKAAARGFLGALRPQDSAAVVAFNTSLFVVAPFTAAAASRAAALERVTPAGNTALFDALVRAAEVFQSHETRRALVVFTDGEDNSSRASLTSAREALQAADTVVYAVCQGVGADDRKLRAELETLTSETGGEAFFSSDMGSVRGHFSRILKDLSEQYVLGYVPQKPLGAGEWRKITVSVSHTNAQVRSRQGYFATSRAKN
jgi:Ca-activated chloride channel homolog